jgi:hypothetical protein
MLSIGFASQFAGFASKFVDVHKLISTTRYYPYFRA